jgi:predicted nucleic acid-binding protein/post-segregation antitoxin (ccd killing protein)
LLLGENLNKSVTVSTKIPQELKEKIKQLKIKPSRPLRKAIEDEVRRREAEKLAEEIDRLKPTLDMVSVEEVVKSIREDRERAQMKYLFDSLAILRAIKENKIGLLIGNKTLELARYELGNVIWKNFSLQARIPDRELKALAKIIKQTLNLMEITQITCSEEEILETAAQLKITFYDASYVYCTKAEELPLITEDLHLLKKITSYIEASKLNDIKQQNQKTSYPAPKA